MFIHCQFNIGEGPNDSNAVAITFVVAGDSEWQAELFQVIRGVLDERMATGEGAKAKSAIALLPMGFRAPIHDHDDEEDGS